ncbi:MAG: M36 family metallopeptidase [Nannocystaceae bacterium]
MFAPLTLIGLAAGIAATAHAPIATAAERPLFDAAGEVASELAELSTIRAPSLRPGAVLARNTDRGVPSLLLGDKAAPAPAGASFEVAARHHLKGVRAAYGVSDAVIDAARPLFTHDIGRGGVIVALRQTVAGVDVFCGDLKVLLDRDRRLVAVSGSPHPAARADLAQRFDLGEPAAVNAALSDLYGPALAAALPLARSAARPVADANFYTLAADAGPTAIHMRAPALVKPVYYPLGDGLLPAYFVETQTYRGADGELEGYQYVVAADDGRVLHRRSMIASENFSYRVWADEGGDMRPADGPEVDNTPYPKDAPEEGSLGFVKPALITIEGFNTNPDGDADPWLPPGATETVGNNVDAYVDHTSPSGYNPENGEFRALINGDNTFDYIYDSSEEPLSSPEQSLAAIVQLFYDVNWLHDYWYDSGFNEAAGNAQDDNFGRGGVDGDRLQAQAQDGALTGSRNNANMMTPTDGVSPVMQMYLWTPRNSAGTLTISPSEQSFEISKGQFGPVEYDVSGPLVLVDDGAGTTTDGCEPPVNDVAGKIVLIDRGDCTFETKVNYAEAAGAIAVIIANNVEGGTPGLGNDDGMNDPTIPTQAVSIGDGELIKAALEQGSVTAAMYGDADAERDGTIDNMIVAHEWGHYIHNRLVECSSTQCRAMGEGWGDFVALHMSLREGDDMNGTYASQTYAGFDKTGYFGIRRVPYSNDPTKNALTFRHIGNDNPLDVAHPIRSNGIQNSEVHNAGEVWASMMWDLYTDLHKDNPDKSFDEVRRALTDYVVAGMILAPPAPTYTEQRDAILIAVAQFDEDDFVTAAEAFAKRGAGTCAESPPRDSSDFTGVVESYELRANATVTSLNVGEGADSCDNDGVIDGGESGSLTLELYNNGVQELAAGATVELISPTPTLVFPEGASKTLPAIPRLDKLDLAFPIAVADGAASDEHFALKVRVTAPGGCVEVHDLELPLVIHGDIHVNSTKVDDVEVPESPWAISGNAGSLVWGREATPSGYVWFGANIGSASDTSLVSPPLEVVSGEPLVISFEHAHKFEYSESIAWDGGVLEISDNDGETWTDVTALGVDAGYNGTINSEANPIHGQAAYTDESPDYPNMTQVSLDFGEALAGKTIRMRFRIGTDAAMGGPGWAIDNIAVAGISNTPFPSWIPDNCGMGPTTTSGSESDSGDTVGDTDANTDGSASASTGGADGFDDEGCGCVVREPTPAEKLASLALWLGLVGVSRRRRRR